MAILNGGISKGWDHSYKDICETDHSKLEPFKNRTFKHSVMGWRSVFRVPILSPHSVFLPCLGVWLSLH